MIDNLLNGPLACAQFGYWQHRIEGAQSTAMVEETIRIHGPGGSNTDNDTATGRLFAVAMPWRLLNIAVALVFIVVFFVGAMQIMFGVCMIVEEGLVS